jgi:acyl carrier protein
MERRDQVTETEIEPLDVIRGILHQILEEYAEDDVEITSDSTFQEGLGLESIDLVTLATRLIDRYGERVNLAEFLAERELDELVELTVGQVADYVRSKV